MYRTLLPQLYAIGIIVFLNSYLRILKYNSISLALCYELFGGFSLYGFPSYVTVSLCCLNLIPNLICYVKRSM
ncbi:hypothetical protein L5515_002202 [Caenorhabditis briggsae]|uniref:Uncharacterized protein n=1 Tax=Caenorhabditis briggsae TaxID=6238 RepID=A0AAE9E836_CAEBR|nr:hypothetical protein L5515_002202 [Caenorhabditis briggsae]